jgi:hypothetical protein
MFDWTSHKIELLHQIFPKNPKVLFPLLGEGRVSLFLHTANQWDTPNSIEQQQEESLRSFKSSLTLENTMSMREMKERFCEEREGKEG